MVDNVLYNVLMTIRTRPHRHERIADRQHKARLETLANEEGFAPNQPRTSYLVSAPSKERGRLGYHHYKKQLRRPCTFKGELHKQNTACDYQCRIYSLGDDDVFEKPSPIINLTTSEVKLVKKFKSTDKPKQVKQNASFGYDFGQDRKLINSVLAESTHNDIKVTTTRFGVSVPNTNIAKTE